MKFTKILVFLFLGIVFLMPLDIKAYNVCTYKQGGIAGALAGDYMNLYVEGDKVIAKQNVNGVFDGNLKTYNTDYSPSDLNGKCPTADICDLGSGKVGACSGITLASSRFVYNSSASGDEATLATHVNDFTFKGGSGEAQYSSMISGCPSDKGAFKLIGIAYDLLKIIIPLALVIFGTIDMAKAVISQNENEMKKAQSAFLRRIGAAVVAFLAFVIFEMILGMVSNASEALDCVKTIIS